MKKLSRYYSSSVQNDLGASLNQEMIYSATRGGVFTAPAEIELPFRFPMNLLLSVQPRTSRRVQHTVC